MRILELLRGMAKRRVKIDRAGIAADATAIEQLALQKFTNAVNTGRSKVVGTVTGAAESVQQRMGQIAEDGRFGPISAGALIGGISPDTPDEPPAEIVIDETVIGAGEVFIDSVDLNEMSEITEVEIAAVEAAGDQSGNVA